MRPCHLAIEGFSAFRDRTEVDFADADLFALVGPTGAGKSSLIDAMVFALYGAVPRYESENLVHPVVTQGAVEARVRLDFQVRGVDHSATRVVRRTKTGATTREARLERFDAGGDGVVLADDAKGLTAAVTDLIGLDLEQFTKCVVLPQGAFAALLHDTKAKRQDLLVKLLDLGVYERIAAAARSEAKGLGYRVESLDQQLRRSQHATDEVVTAAEARVGAVQALLAEVDAAAPVLADLDASIGAIGTELETVDISLAALDRIQVPEDAAGVAERARAATEAARAATEAEASTAHAVAEAQAAVDRLGDAAELRRLQQDHAALARLIEKVDTGAGLVAELADASARHHAAAESAVARLADVAATLERARIGNAAADIARHLHTGDDCPVCGQEIAAVPVFDSAELDRAESAWRRATEAEREAATARTAHETTLAEYRARLDQRVEERDAVAARLVQAPARDEVERLLALLGEAERALAEARRADTEARASAARRRQEAEAASGRIGAARASFTAARDAVVGLGPPAVADDLAADWEALAGWAVEQRELAGVRAADARSEREALVKRRAEQVDLLTDQARRAGVDAASPEHLRDACLTEAARGTERLEQLVAERDRAGALREERAGLVERRQVHELLADQLGARGFEAWLLDEALDVLLAGASTWLEQLSSGRYAMTVDDKNQFAVIDHANADERRLARTLSGGETFLASLALALALAERVSELSSVGGARLDAIFLDEGFGTLDPATLDVVAGAIEELGATGRMVGIVSHVRELAERVPVRFEITKGPSTSTVRRVDT